MVGTACHSFCGHAAPAQCRAHDGEGPREGPEAARTDVVAEGGWSISEVVGKWPLAVVAAFPPYTIPLAFLSLSLFSLSPSSLSLLPSHSLLLSPIYVLGLPVVPAGFVSPHWWHTGPKRLPIPGITPPGWVGLGTLLQEAAGMD